MKIRPIRNWEGYTIDENGNIYNKHGKKLRPKKVLNENPIFCKYYITLCKNCKSKGYDIAYLVADSFLPNPKHYKKVKHLDGNGLNNNVDNLQWCDNYEILSHRKNSTREKRIENIKNVLKEYNINIDGDIAIQIINILK